MQYKVEKNLFSKTDGPNTVRIGFEFTDYPVTVTVKEEYLIYDMVSIISAIGGTMRLCIRLSFQDTYLLESACITPAWSKRHEKTVSKKEDEKGEKTASITFESQLKKR